MTIHHVACIRGQECVILQNAIGIIPEEGVDSSGRTVVYIDFPISNPSEWMETHYWDGSSWQDRDPRPNAYSYWSEEESNWVWNHEDIMNEVRHTRTRKLRQSDWTQMSDSPLSEDDKMLWAIYRQDLRDVPQNNTNINSVDDVVWPTAP